MNTAGRVCFSFMAMIDCIISWLAPNTSSTPVSRLRRAFDRGADHVDGNDDIGGIADQVERHGIVDAAVDIQPPVARHRPEHGRDGGGRGKRGIEVAALQHRKAVPEEIGCGHLQRDFQLGEILAGSRRAGTISGCARC